MKKKKKKKEHYGPITSAQPNVRINECTNAVMHTSSHARTHVHTHKQTSERANERTNEQTNERKNERTNQRTSERERRKLKPVAGGIERKTLHGYYSRRFQRVLLPNCDNSAQNIASATLHLHNLCTFNCFMLRSIRSPILGLSSVLDAPLASLQ